MNMLCVFFARFITSSDPAMEIGILDMFGFEEFQRNEFEQVRSGCPF